MGVLNKGIGIVMVDVRYMDLCFGGKLWLC